VQGQGLDALRPLVDEVVQKPLDPRHPLWRIHLVELDGQGALIAKVHHCIGDGFALLGLLRRLADEATPHAEASPKLPERALNLWRFAQAVLDVMTLGADSTTVLKHPLRGERHVAWSRAFSLNRVRAEAHRRDVKINDLLIAVLTGALREQLRASGARVNEIDVRALVPVNLRSPGDDTLGNRFGLVFLPLPVRERSTMKRLQIVAETMRALKHWPDAMAVYAVLQTLGWLPGATVRAVTQFFARKASLVITNLPGPEEALSLAGHRIAHVLFWVPHPARLGLGVSILSYAGEVRIGVRADTAVMRNPADLIRRFERDLDHVMPGSGRVRTSTRNKAVEWKA
jgi:diacylglycerol O-acyltransferase